MDMLEDRTIVGTKWFKQRIVMDSAPFGIKTAVQTGGVSAVLVPRAGGDGGCRSDLQLQGFILPLEEADALLHGFKVATDIIGRI